MQFVAILLVAVGALTGLALLSLQVRRYPALGAAGIAAVILSQWEYTQQPAIASIVGVELTPNDGLAAVLLGSCLGVRVGRPAGATLAAGCMLGLLLSSSLLRGIVEFGLGAAANEARVLYLAAAVLIWSVVQVHRQDFHLDDRRVLFWLGLGLVLVTAYHVAVRGVGNADDLISVGNADERQTSRPLVAGQAFVLVLIFLRTLWTHLNERTSVLRGLGLVFMLGAVAVSQQRTVWVALAVGLCVLVVTSGRARVAARLLLGGSLIAAMFIAVLVTVDGAERVSSALGQSLGSRGTFEARESGWVDLIERQSARGFIDVVVGSPFGSGYARFEGNVLVTYSPHNWFLFIGTRAGALGLVALMLFIGGLILRAFKAKSPEMLAAVSCFCVFAWTYQWPWYAVGLFAFVTAPRAQIFMKSARRRDLPVPVDIRRPTARRLVSR